MPMKRSPSPHDHDTSSKKQRCEEKKVRNLLMLNKDCPRIFMTVSNVIPKHQKPSSNPDQETAALIPARQPGTKYDVLDEIVESHSGDSSSLDPPRSPTFPFDNPEFILPLHPGYGSADLERRPGSPARTHRPLERFRLGDEPPQSRRQTRPRWTLVVPLPDPYYDEILWAQGFMQRILHLYARLPLSDDGLEQLFIKVEKDGHNRPDFQVYGQPHRKIGLGDRVLCRGELQNVWSVAVEETQREGFTYLFFANYETWQYARVRLRTTHFWNQDDEPERPGCAAEVESD
ncbi:hypothetical protein C8R43DRAFT_1126788 [Mycena crocata]|nr:hypothetical protein C8R43DRAFT_1126788 [Mycena crocata]